MDVKIFSSNNLSTTPEKMKNLFDDLGKATLRGVRKCPKCGTFNGTRGISCKNKACNAVFKDKEKKKGHSSESVKVITGSTVQVFSVRLRDRGPDYRGFVQLPLVQDLDGNPAESVDPAVLSQAARCYVDNCPKNCETNLHTAACNHIKGAISCSEVATPLTLKNSVLNSLNVSNETKQAIWLLATETTGPLVQRVTKNIMVVKCKPNPKQPLGFLHFSFFEISRNRTAPEHKFQCSCRAFKASKTGTGVPKVDESQKRCVHFYACICAFASDDKLHDEFGYYINLDSQALPERRLITLYHTVDPNQPSDTGEAVEIVIEDTLLVPPAKKARIETVAVGDLEEQVQASSALLTLQDSGNTPKKQTPTKPIQSKPTAPTPKKQITNAPVDESVTIGFTGWLASVTERINQTMHYQFDGNPEPLVFHAPQAFFDCLQQRISAGQKKKRLPNSTTGFVRRDALPLGTFTKYTWHITNILHVKQIFDTTEYPLEVTRSFVENRDNTYDLYEVPKVQVENIDDAFRPAGSKGQTPIRPFELRTYLKVGNTTADQKEPTPFIIEWIPDILPKTHIGELRIKFEYGHQRNGQIEHRPSAQNLELQTIQVQQLG
ncbi:uncharacterized protein C2orf42-like isoform X2 [Lineus longissimus]